MGTKFSELPVNDILTGAELVCLSQTQDAVLTSVKATVDELGEFVVTNEALLTTIATDTTFITELTSDATFITELTTNSSYISNQLAVLRTEVESELLTTYTLELLDGEHKWKSLTNAASITLTVPPQASVAWLDNTYIELYQGGAGAVTVQGGVGVTIRVNENLTPVTNGIYSVAGLKRIASNEWVLFGNLVPA